MIRGQAFDECVDVDNRWIETGGALERG